MEDPWYIFKNDAFVISIFVSSVDSVDNGEFEKRDDDDIFLDEEENEEEFRKMRHKREMFLKKKLVTEDDDVESILGDSQILRVGQQIFKNKSFNSQNSTPIDKTEETKEPFTLLVSFAVLILQCLYNFLLRTREDHF